MEKWIAGTSSRSLWKSECDFLLFPIISNETKLNDCPYTVSPGHTAWPFPPGLEADLLLLPFRVFVVSVCHPGLVWLQEGPAQLHLASAAKGWVAGYWEVTGELPRSKGTKLARMGKAESRPWEPQELEAAQTLVLCVQTSHLTGL